MDPECDAEWAEAELEELDRLLGQDHSHDPGRYARVLGLEADQAGRPLEQWGMRNEFGNLQVEFRRGFLVCRDLPRLVVRLERAAAFLEDGGVLRRLAGYFFKLLAWADANHMRGSRQILDCYSTCKSGRFTSFAGCVHWISHHLADKMTAVLRAAESLECYVGAPKGAWAAPTSNRSDALAAMTSPERRMRTTRTMATPGTRWTSGRRTATGPSAVGPGLRRPRRPARADVRGLAGAGPAGRSGRPSG